MFHLPNVYPILALVSLFIAFPTRAQQNGEAMVLDHKDKSSTIHLQRQDSQASDLTKVQYIDANGLPVLVQFTYVGPPKILPIASADSYPEGSTINLICTVSGGQRKGLALTWAKDGNLINDDFFRYPSKVSDNISVEKTGIDITILRISNASYANSGRFSCNAKNPLGEDSTSVNIVINVELKWAQLPEDSEVGLNQDIRISCDAIGQPQPQIIWTKHPGPYRANNATTKPVIVSQGKTLKIDKAQYKDSGLYECVAKNGVDQDLRRIIQVKVRGKLS